MTTTAGPVARPASPSSPGPRRWLPRRMTETAVLLLAVMLVAGTVAGIILGRGLSNDTAPPASPGDGLAWLRDRPAGEAVQVNPANGRPENRLTVAAPGTPFELAQRDGLLVVTTADGRLTIIDVATLATTGGYQGTAGTLALLNDEHLFAVDLGAGTISELDPADGRVIATWTANLPLTDATLDGNGTVWALRTDRQLFELTAIDGQLIEVSAPVAIGAAGPYATLVGLIEGGTTVLAPGDPATGAEAGTAVRIGTDSDGATIVPGLTGPIVAADRASGDGVISVSKPETSTVLLIGPDGTIAVDTTPYGCDRPAESLEDDGLSHISCQGAGLVIALDAQGQHAPPDIRFAPGTSPDISLHDGHVLAIAGNTVYVDGQPTDLSGFPVPAAPPKPKQNNPPGNPPPGGGNQNPPINPPPGDDPPPVDDPPPDDPPPPPDLPIEGELVILDITSTYGQFAPPCEIPDPIPSPPWIPDCWSEQWYTYTATLNSEWASFGGLGGTCALRAYVGSTLVREVGHACSAASVPLGEGTGETWSVAVHACLDGSCVYSAWEPVQTTRRHRCTIGGCYPV